MASWCVWGDWVNQHTDLLFFASRQSFAVNLLNQLKRSELILFNKKVGILILIVGLGGLISGLTYLLIGWNPQVDFEAGGRNVGDLFGLVSHSFTNTDVAGLNTLSCNLVRLDLSWGEIEPSPDVWNFNGSDYYLNGTLVNSTLLPPPTRNLDGEFALADQAHIQLLIILDYTPLWAVSSEYFAENASEGGDIWLPPDDNAWGNMCQVVMNCYAGNPALYGFEVWNEPSGGFMHGSNKDNDYIAMVKIALQQAQLINNATGQHLVKVFATDWTHYQPLITDSWILANLDGGAWHYYGQLPERIRDDFNINNATRPNAHFQLLITETGYPIGTGYTADSYQLLQKSKPNF